MRIPIATCVLAVTGLLAGCQPSPPSASSSPAIASSGAAVPARPGAAGASVPARAAATATPPGDHATTPHYKIAVDLPTLPSEEAPLAAALRATADHAKREFLAALPDPVQLPEFADRQFDLFLEFKVAARTPAFTSVLETGGEDTGGAHPIPIVATFVFDRDAGRMLTLDELFADPGAARNALAAFARAALEKQLMADAPKPGEGSPEALREWKTNLLSMLRDGTQPTAANYAQFVVRAGGDAGAPSPGLTLVFPPYQVAAYVYGTRMVDVPAHVFAEFLAPAYAAAFTNH